MKLYRPERMSDDEYLFSRSLLHKIDNFNSNKEEYKSRVKGKNLIKRDVLY